MKQRLYIGTFKDSVFSTEFDSLRGEFSEVVKTIAGGGMPSFVTSDNNTNTLYCLYEETGGVKCFQVNAKTGEIVLKNFISEKSTGPGVTDLALSNYVEGQKRFIGVVGYGLGDYYLHPVGSEGSLVERSNFHFQDVGSGPNVERQNEPHAHNICWSADNRFFFISDLGTDDIMQFVFNPNDGLVLQNSPPSVKVDPGAGPRTLVRSSCANVFYGTNELNSTLNIYKMNENGTLKILRTISTLIENYIGPSNYPSMPCVSPNGKWLYVANRGDNSIASFEILANGELSNKPFFYSCGGNWPRYMGFDLTGSYLLVCNQNSNSVVAFAHETDSGVLKQVDKCDAVAATCFTAFPI